MTEGGFWGGERQAPLVKQDFHLSEVETKEAIIVYVNPLVGAVISVYKQVST